MGRSEGGSRLGRGLRQTRTLDWRLRWIGEVRRTTRTEIEGNSASVIVPTVYNYKEDGRPAPEEGRWFALQAENGAWKISA